MILSNGSFITDLKEKEMSYHIVRKLRNQYKINIIIYRLGWTHETFETLYNSKENKIIVQNYNFKLLEPSVICTNSLKYCGKEQVYDYYIKNINSNLLPKNIVWN